MIKTTTCIHAACDICGAVPDNYNDGFDLFEPGQESDALSAAEGVDWWTDRATQLVVCDKRDEPHLAKAAQILAELPEAERPTFLTYWPEFDEQGRPPHVLLKAATPADPSR